MAWSPPCGQTSIWPAICCRYRTTNSAGLSGAKPTTMLTMPEVAVVLRRGARVALHEVGVARRRALEGALAEQVVHEGADVEPDLRPQRLVVRLEHHPLQAAIEALLDVEREPADRDVLVLAAEAVVAVHRARAPVDDAVREDADGVDAPWVDHAVLAVGEAAARRR